MSESITEECRPRILLLAYACSPDHGSEAGIGWNHALEMSKYFDVSVISLKHPYGRNILRYFRRHGLVPGLRFHFVSKNWCERILTRIPGVRYFAYRTWNRRALGMARRLHETVGFDLVHHLNYCGYREPGYLWKLDVPFVWGPVGGTQNYPLRFLLEADLVGAICEAVRTALNTLQLRFSPRVRQAARRATVLMAANSTNQHDFERVHRVRPVLFLETGVKTVSERAGRVRSESQPLRILWSGQLAAWKGLSLLIKALARVPKDVPWEVRILGQGRLERRYQRLARRLNVDEQITWMGWRPHRQALVQYDWADLFAFTSLRDTSGNVVLESLAAGVPVICLDHQGVHDIVTDDCGIKIPVTHPRDVTARLAEAITSLARDTEQRARLAEGALDRAREYLWSRRGEQFAAFYRNALDIVDRPVPHSDSDVSELRVVGGSRSQPRNLKPTRRSSCDVTSESLCPTTCPGRTSSMSRNSDNLQPQQPAAGLVSAGRMKTHLRDWAKSAAGHAGAGLNRLLGSRAEGTFTIFLYHRVAHRVPGVSEPSFNVTPNRFRQQLTGLLDRGYEFRSLGQMLVAGDSANERTAVITFDDGFSDVYTNAWPVLSEYRIPATVFVSTAYLDSANPFPFDHWALAHQDRLPEEAYRPLTTAQCEAMLQSGLVELGSHTHTHKDFRARSDRFESDLNESIDVLHARFGLRAVSFAFPYGRRYFGYASHEMMAVARRSGVTCALTTDAVPVQPSSDPFGWGRFNAYEWDGAATLAAKANGWYGWAPRLQEWCTRRRHAGASNYSTRKLTAYEGSA